MSPDDCLVHGQDDGNCKIDPDDLEKLGIPDEQLSQYLGELSLSMSLRLGGLVAGAVASHAHANTADTSLGSAVAAYGQHILVCLVMFKYDEDLNTQLGGNTAWFQPGGLILAVWLLAQMILKMLTSAPVGQSLGTNEGYVPQ